MTDAFDVLARWPDDGPHSLEELAEEINAETDDLEPFLRQLVIADAVTRVGIKPTTYDLTALGGILASGPHGGRLVEVGDRS
jgi:predicted transcriptional regulator